MWAKIYDLVVHKTNETKKTNKQKIKQDFDSRNKEKKAIRSTQRRTQRRNEAMDATMDAMRETVQNLY